MAQSGRQQPAVAQLVDVVGDHSVRSYSPSYGSINEEYAAARPVIHVTDSESVSLIQHDETQHWSHFTTTDDSCRDTEDDALSRWSQGPTNLQNGDSKRTLGVFSGVFSPVALSMFSALLFMRVGFVLGQAGVIETLVQFFLAYFIMYMTILSICAISTNGAIEGGGVYFMISRALGPEFGGSIGILFFCAQVVSCALYISGFVEALVDNFGINGTLVHNASGLPTGALTNDVRWWNYLYSTVVLALCLVVSLVGGSMFGKTSIFTLSVLIVCMLSMIISLLARHGMCIDYPESNKLVPDPSRLNDSNVADYFQYPNCSSSQAKYTGLSTETFINNTFSNLTDDYITGRQMTFAAVFSVLFSSVTGIMGGANMSGELKNPAKAIPHGTLAATTFTLIIYILETFLIAATTSRELLTGNYNFLLTVNLWPPFVVIGVFAATLSAAMANLIGGSRILYAVAKDEIYWLLLKPATITTSSGNPVVAVLIAWFLVQLVLLIGSLNAIAPMCSELFLLSYAATNLACLALDLTSAPNFRPTFRYFSVHTAVLGLIGCLSMCFLVDPIYATIAITVLIILVVVLHLRSLDTPWGSITQALIFHQVRKYLLLLDSRKSHIKFWRPQMLLLVANPRTCCPLIDFVNDLKKTGLYVIGHVNTTGTMDLYSDNPDPVQLEYSNWLALVDHLKVKAFVELTMCQSVREGVRHLIRVSGLGGMKPNTVCLGFYDDTPAMDTLHHNLATSTSRLRLTGRRRAEENNPDSVVNVNELCCCFPNPQQQQPQQTTTTHNSLSVVEYVGILCDALRMNKNICLFRHFSEFDKCAVFSRSKPLSIDVWPVDFFAPAATCKSQFDSTCLFVLQLACILRMVPGWKKHCTLRVFACVSLGTDSAEAQRKKRRLGDYLTALRIRSKIQLVAWEDSRSQRAFHEETDSEAVYLRSTGLPTDEDVRRVNGLIHEQSANTAIVFLYLPRPPADYTQHEHYLHCLQLMTSDLPPTILVHGLHPVTSTTL